MISVKILKIFQGIIKSSMICQILMFSKNSFSFVQLGIGVANKYCFYLNENYL